MAMQKYGKKGSGDNVKVKSKKPKKGKKLAGVPDDFDAFYNDAEGDRASEYKKDKKDKKDKKKRRKMKHQDDD